MFVGSYKLLHILRKRDMYISWKGIPKKKFHSLLESNCDKLTHLTHSTNTDVYSF